MRTHYPILLSCILFGQVHAQLAPGTAAPLERHLREVNKEWTHMDPAVTGGGAAVRFDNEAARIRTHLLLVAERLRARTPEALPPQARAQRLQLLDRLEVYARAERFPRNLVLPVRNPVFIDPAGTACAVGQLMIESGDRALATRISEEMNLAYVHDMHRTDVDAWAMAHGFSEDELAWIQPGYPPPLPWSTLGAGTNGEVRELLRLANGDLLVAGNFTQAGGIAAYHVARYNGTTYLPMPGLPDGPINAAIEFNGSVYIGGSFNDGLNDLARWTGSTWELSAAFSSKYGETTALHVHAGQLHAAGIASGFAGFSHEVHKLQGGLWELVGNTLNDRINALATLGDTLVCAGRFTAPFAQQDSSLLHVAYLDGNTWITLANGLDGEVHDMLVYDGHLYAGGDLVSEIFTRFGLARIHTGGPWESLMPNKAYYMFSPLDAMVRILDLELFNNKLYLGGDFLCAQGLESGMGLAVYNGTPDDVQPLCEFMGPVNSVAVIGAADMVIGGASEPYANIAHLELELGVPGAGSTSAGPLAWPVPVQDQLTVLDPAADSGPVDVQVIDAEGRLVARSTARGDRITVGTQALVPGRYTVRLQQGDRVRYAPFLKQ